MTKIFAYGTLSKDSLSRFKKTANKALSANPMLQNNEALVDRFMTARVAANDGGTIEAAEEDAEYAEEL